MNFVAFTERHRRSFLFLAFALALAGLFAVIVLPVGLFPVTSFPRIRINVDAGSRPAKQMLIDVTEPMEKAARAVPGAVDVTSTTSRGSAQLFVDFPWGTNMTQALLSVNAAFAQAMPDLPTGTGYEALQMSPTAVFPFISYALTSDKISPDELKQLAQYQIAPLLTGVSGIRKVGVLGGQTPEVQVHINPQKLRAHGLTLDDITKALSETNTITAVGRLEDNDLLYLAVANNAFTSVDSVRNVALSAGKDGIIRLSDIADIGLGQVPQWLLVDNNGQPAVTFDVFQQDNASSLDLAKEVDKRLSDFMKTQPKSIQLHKWYDQTELVRSSISALEEAILIGLVFAALVLLAFLRNWRATLVAIMVVPLSVLITVLLLSALGMTFNIMTLGGIAAAIGLLIDDVIVMIEQIARRAGVPGVEHPRETVLAATKEFLAPLIGSSLATIIIFVPLAFLSGVTGAFFKFLSLTMASALIISWLLTAFVVPLLSRGIIDFSKWHDPEHGRETWLRRTHGQILRTLFAYPLIIAFGAVILIGAGYLSYSP
ncbi:MAG: efflux RND transporter permease subunit [Alphaproteobacteria bacterium]|nr:efflux RND transporter permease subunit [Alphaproteobacteria bacterium]